MMISLFDSVENTVGEGQNASPIPKMFSKASFLRVVKSRDYVIMSLIQRLTLSQMTNFRLFQTERVCRRQF